MGNAGSGAGGSCGGVGSGGLCVGKSSGTFSWMCPKVTWQKHSGFVCEHEGVVIISRGLGLCRGSDGVRVRVRVDSSQSSIESSQPTQCSSAMVVLK